MKTRYTIHPDITTSDTCYLVSQNGKDWKAALGPYMGEYGRVNNWLHTCNKGIVALQRINEKMPRYYYTDVNKNGSLAFMPVTLHNPSYLVGEGGGYIFFVKDQFLPGTRQPIFAVDAKNREIYQTAFVNMQKRLIYQMLNVGEWSHILSKVDMDEEYMDVWYIWSSNDGFKTVSEINSMMPQFPNYGLDIKIAYIEDADGNPHYRILVTRKTTESGVERIACDVYDFEDSFNNQPTIYQDVAKTFNSPIVGDALTSSSPLTQSVEYAQYRNYINNSFASGGYFEYLPDFRILQWQSSWDSFAFQNVYYFKDGVLSYPYEFICLKNITGGNILSVIEADGINVPKDSYSFYTGQIYLDYKNRSWNRRG